MTLDELVEHILSVSSAARAEFEYLEKEWNDEAVPPTVLLGAMGRAVAVDLPTMPQAKVDIVFGAVERALGTDDSALSDAVATGFLEALENKAVRTGLDVEFVRTRIGPMALTYLLEWEKYSKGQLDWQVEGPQRGPKH